MTLLLFESRCFY